MLTSQKTSEITELSIGIPASLRLCLKWIHKHAVEPNNQSIRGGTQASLKGIRIKEIRVFLDNLERVLREVHGKIKIDGVWTIAMHKGGQHIPHVHPKGHYSGVCYIEVPDNTSGLLQIGKSLETTITPNAGKIVTFPSWMPHGTTVYNGEHSRITVAFDMVKDEIHPRPDNA